MPENNKKVLPKDIDSDYSLPGRFEESNSDFFNLEPIKSKPKNSGIIIMAIAFVVISIGFFSYYFLNQTEIDSRIIQNTLNRDPEQELVRKYNVGKYGSEHTHAAIVFFVDDKQLNFGKAHFQLASRYIHFENHNPVIIHKHATNVPLEMLFSSVGIQVTPDCILLKSDKSFDTKKDRFCTEQNKSLLFFVNGEPYHSDISQYVIEENDRILVFLGEEKLISKNLAYLKSMKIPNVPKKIPQHSENEIFI